MAASRSIRVILCTMALLMASPLGVRCEEKSDSLNELRATRKKLAFEKRFIANNDGCDSLYYPRDQKISKALFLKERTTAMAGSQVNTLSYCTISSGFGQFTHNTSAGEILRHSPSDFGIAPEKRNITSELIAMKTDPLQLIVDFGHKNNQEVFWSMRMNDTHDVAHRPEKPYFLFPQLKKDHPDWLVGSHLKRQPQGRWSSVDYARPEIRDLAFQYIEEVCNNYDIDGIELDYFRHLCYFKNVAKGGEATFQEIDQLTALMQRIRTMTEQRGLERGRPILVSIRVPDSIEYCHSMGFDLEQWMEQGLIDILITTGYFRLNPWDYSVKLGQKYGVAVYPCLSDSRVKGETRFLRGSLESLRGRAMNAWHSGSQGLYIYNHFNPNSPMWNELGDPETLRHKNKLYFVTVRDGNPNRFLARGKLHQTVPILTPSSPMMLSPNSESHFKLSVADDVLSAEKNGQHCKAVLHLNIPGAVDPSRLLVRLNGKDLKKYHHPKNWLDYEVPVSYLQQGDNQVSVNLTAQKMAQDQWNIIYTGNALPQKPWTADRQTNNTVRKIEQDSLLIADRGTVSGDYLYHRYPWGTAVDSKTVLEANVKVISGHNAIIFANSVSGNRLILQPDYISLYHNKKNRFPMNTTDAYHLYRVEMHGTQVKVFVDGILKFDEPKALIPRAGYSRNEVAFGAANSFDLGEAYWKSFKARTTNLSIHDAVMSLSYSKK